MSCWSMYRGHCAGKRSAVCGGANGKRHVTGGERVVSKLAEEYNTNLNTKLNVCSPHKISHIHLSTSPTNHALSGTPTLAHSSNPLRSLMPLPAHIIFSPRLIHDLHPLLHILSPLTPNRHPNNSNTNQHAAHCLQRPTHHQ